MTSNLSKKSGKSVKDKRRLIDFTLTSECNIERFNSRAEEDIYKAHLDKTSCADMAARFGFLEIGPVSVDLRVKMIAKETWEVKGKVDVELVQACVVTGEPVEETATIIIEERYVPVLDETDDDIEIDISAVDVELLEEGVIPLGELVQQSIALGVDNHPRVPNAPEDYQAGPEIKVENPFQKLSQLKK